MPPGNAGPGYWTSRETCAGPTRPARRPPRAGDGRACNAATLVGPDGAVCGRHRKVHLFGDLDRALFAASDEPPRAFDFGGSRVGILICYDVEFPEAVRRLAVDGARAVLVPTANMAGREEVQELLTWPTGGRTCTASALYLCSWLPCDR